MSARISGFGVHSQTRGKTATGPGISTESGGERPASREGISWNAPRNAGSVSVGKSAREEERSELGKSRARRRIWGERGLAVRGRRPI